jgi:probable rRNA maturation factor
VHNRQRKLPLDCRLLETIANTLLTELLRIEFSELEISVVSAAEMSRLNEEFLRHQGPTDVLAFDYTEPGRSGERCAEVFLCADVAVVQSARFRTTWPSELVRYLVHGLLHLVGYDDHRRVDRLRMKREENRLLRALGRCFDFNAVANTRSRISGRT